MTTLARRFHAICENEPRDNLLDRLSLVSGDRNDYAALSEHHYRDQKPATMSRVLAFRDGEGDETVAVLVESMPPLNCRMRDEALRGRYRSVADRRVRAAMINRELRVISRVIVHPQWRGLGLATKLVQSALKSATTVFTESIAAMGGVHPFFLHAGMTAYPRPPHAHDARLRAAFQSINIGDHTLASRTLVKEKLSERPVAEQRWMQRELEHWYRTARRKRDPVSLETMLAIGQRALICEPVYFLHDNRMLEHG